MRTTTSQGPRLLPTAQETKPILAVKSPPTWAVGRAGLEPGFGKVVSTVFHRVVLPCEICRQGSLVVPDKLGEGVLRSVGHKVQIRVEFGVWKKGGKGVAQRQISGTGRRASNSLKLEVEKEDQVPTTGDDGENLPRIIESTWRGGGQIS